MRRRGVWRGVDAVAALTLLVHAPCGAGRGVPPAAAAVEALGLHFRVVGDEFLVMPPEALGFLSELLGKRADLTPPT